MIQENGIRIGNSFEHDCAWSYRNDIICKTFNFNWEARDWYAVGECTLDLQYINPISLTPGILEKAGFKYKSDGISKDWYTGLNPITHDWVFSVRWVDGFAHPFYKNSYHPIKYLHQLQNLFYALTGEELQIDL